MGSHSSGLCFVVLQSRRPMGLCDVSAPLMVSDFSCQHCCRPTRSMIMIVLSPYCIMNACTTARSETGGKLCTCNAHALMFALICMRCINACMHPDPKKAGRYATHMRRCWHLHRLCMYVSSHADAVMMSESGMVIFMESESHLLHSLKHFWNKTFPSFRSRV